MSALAARIQDAQTRLVKLRDDLTAHLASYDEASATPDQITIGQELNARIETSEKSLEMLKAAEQRLAATAEPAPPASNGGGTGTALTVRNPRPFAQPMKVRPQDHVWRALTVRCRQHFDPQRRPAIDIMRETYGEDEGTKAVFDVITRAATIPADTVTSGWASQLVQTSIQDFFEALIPNSVYPALRSRGGGFTFGRNGALSIPTRSTSPTIAGSFYAQGAPIPVRQGAFSAISLTPKHMGVISTFTRDIAEHSTPAIEGLIRQAIVDDTSIAIDTILLDGTAADTTRPAGLRAGVAESPNSTLTTLDGLVADFKAIAQSLITGTLGNVRNPVWILNPSLVLSIATKTNANGEFPFKEDVANGTMFGWPVIQSTNIPATRMMALDAADFISATGDTPRFDVSDTAVLHMEDTSPAPISTTTTAVAAPVRSLWQTDCFAVRMILDINWAMRRAGVVAWSESFAW
jgi:HK97 family phage major capsid protein